MATLEENVMTIAATVEQLANALKTTSDNLTRCILLVEALSKENKYLSDRADKLEEYTAIMANQIAELSKQLAAHLQIAQ